MPLTVSTKARILVVDDSADIRRLVTYALEEAGCEVLSAEDGFAALSLVKRALPSLVLLDVVMPGMSGFEVCEQLKANEATREIPVIFISALEDAAAETRGLALGAADFVGKPINVPVLLARVNTQLALHAQRRSLEGMFRDVIEFAPDAFILADPLGRIVQINARAEVMFGYRRSELIGQAVEILIPDRLRETHASHRSDEGGRQDGLRMGASLPCRRKDGSEFPGDINLSPLQTNRGRLLMAVVRDSTERNRQEEKLREAVRYARSLIETSMDPLVLIDLQGKVQDANEAACQITGIPRDQLVGSDAINWFTEPEKLIEGFKRVMAEGQALNYELTIRHASGRLYDVHCNAKAFRNEAGEVVGLFATAHDVTESRRIQQEISSSRQRLREMAAQGEAMREYERKSIAREVHDELGQVLTALRMDLTFLDLRHGAQTPELREKFHEMRALVDRAIQGVRNVASNLRPTALDMGLTAAIQWVCEEFRRNSGLPCHLEVAAISEDLAEDRAIGLFRIVQESLTNVLRYAQASEVRIDLRREADTLVLRVHDNGRGFDPAGQGGRKSFGLLGMQERAMALGGRFEISSAPGRGTLVQVTVPLYHPSQWQELA